MEASYSNMAQARDGIERGWIPDWTPASATRIREVHDVANNEVMMAFDLPASAEWKLPAGCEPIAYKDIQPPRFTQAWWPSKTELEREYRFQRCPDTSNGQGPDFIAVGRNASGERALYWTVHVHKR